MRRRRPSSAWLLGPLLGATACLQATEAEPALPIAVVETLNSLALAPRADDGIVEGLRVTLSIEPKLPGPWRVVGRSPKGSQADDAMLQVWVRWKDFVGTEPTSFGSGRSWPLAFGEDGDAARDAALVRRFEVALDPPAGHVLARRVEVRVRLHPVDVLGEEVRSGGVTLEFPMAGMESLIRIPDGDLRQLLEEAGPRDPVELFLRAAAVPIAEREAALGLLIGALPHLPAAEREACYGALHFLTGITNGRTVHGWESWYAAHLVEGDGP